MRLSGNTAPRSARRGFALVELVVTLALFVVFGAITFALVDHHQRALRGVAALLESRSALWQGSEVLAGELRPLAAPAGDVRAASDSALEYRSLVASGVACAVPDASTLELPPDSLAAGVRLTSGVRAVQPGDVAVVFDEGPGRSSVDDAWRAVTVAQISRAASPCAGSALIDSIRDAGKSGYRVRLGASLPSTVTVGAPVRFLRDARFALYRSSTGDWYLGWTDWNVTLGRWNVIQPVAGAYLAYQRAPGASGLSLVYHDSTGVARAPSSTMPFVAAIGATLRTETAQALHVTGLARARHRDSLDTRVAARNRR